MFGLAASAQSVPVQHPAEAAEHRAFLASAAARSGAAATMRSARRLNGSDCSQICPGPRSVAKNKPSPPKSADLILPTILDVVSRRVG